MDLQGATVNPVDASGRITLREHQVDQLDGRAIISQGLDENIYLFSPEQWQNFVKPLTEDDSMDPDMDDLRRLFVGGAVDVELDDRSRLKIPEQLREWAGLKPGQSRAIVMNLGNRWEIWLDSAYRQYMASRREDLKQFARRKFGSGGEADAEAEDQ
jgi:MraZ protein